MQSAGKQTSACLPAYMEEDKLMLSPTSETSRGSSIAEFLSENAPRQPGGNPSPLGDQFSSVLTKTLQDLGFSADQIHVTVRETGQAPTEGATTPGRQFLVTFRAPPAVLDGAEASAATASPVPGNISAAPETETPSEIPPYDPKVGPRITRDMWTQEMLTGDLPAELLRNVVEPAAFLNARVRAALNPTNAHIVSGSDGDSQPLNAVLLSTREQADTMLERLRDLGISPGEVQESEPGGGPFQVDYSGDSRRFFHIGGMNVGLLMQRYAGHVVEYADSLTIEEWSRYATA